MSNQITVEERNKKKTEVMNSINGNSCVTHTSSPIFP